MAIDFKALASLGFLETAAVQPPTPTIVSTDHEDGTGATITLSGYGATTTNELWLSQDGINFTSQGSTWVSDQMVLAIDNGLYWAYVVSSNGELATNSAVIRVTATDDPSAATDNVAVATKTMKATAVYWPPENTYDSYGKPVPRDPFEILVRWDNVVEEFVDEEGVPQMSKAKLIVDRDLEIGGVLMLGELTDIEDYVNPKENPDAWEIKLFSKIADFRGSKYIRQVYL